VGSARPQLSLFTQAAVVAPDALRAALRAIDPDELSPKAALEALYALHRLL
jgi:hypothetical protein